MIVAAETATPTRTLFLSLPPLAATGLVWYGLVCSGHQSRPCVCVCVCVTACACLVLCCCRTCVYVRLCMQCLVCVLICLLAVRAYCAYVLCVLDARACCVCGWCELVVRACMIYVTALCAWLLRVLVRESCALCVRCACLLCALVVCLSCVRVLQYLCLPPSLVLGRTSCNCYRLSFVFLTPSSAVYCRAFVYCHAWNKLLLVLYAAVVGVLAVQMLLVVSLLPLWLSVSGHWSALV